MPIAEALVKILAPVLLLLLAIVAASKLAGRDGAYLGRITSDLPSVLALLIVSTICLLPLAGVNVPDVLGNVALVVVGFYFGKRGKDENEPAGP